MSKYNTVILLLLLYYYYYYKLNKYNKANKYIIMCGSKQYYNNIIINISKCRIITIKTTATAVSADSDGVPLRCWRRSTWFSGALWCTCPRRAAGLGGFCRFRVSVSVWVSSSPPPRVFMARANGDVTPLWPRAASLKPPRSGNDALLGLPAPSASQSGETVLRAGVPHNSPLFCKQLLFFSRTLLEQDEWTHLHYYTIWTKILGSPTVIPTGTLISKVAPYSHTTP